MDEFDLTSIKMEERGVIITISEPLPKTANGSFIARQHTIGITKEQLVAIYEYYILGYGNNDDSSFEGFESSEEDIEDAEY